MHFALMKGSEKEKPRHPGVPEYIQEGFNVMKHRNYAFNVCKKCNKETAPQSSTCPP